MGVEDSLVGDYHVGERRLEHEEELSVAAGALCAVPPCLLSHMGNIGANPDGFKARQRLVAGHG
jgi:hypothetical protein